MIIVVFFTIIATFFIASGSVYAQQSGSGQLHTIQLSAEKFDGGSSSPEYSGSSEWPVGETVVSFYLNGLYLHASQIIVEEFKMWIHWFNEIIFFLSSPTFEFFFSFNGEINTFELFIIDKVIAIILLWKNVI